jgi:hypothetical protein
VGITKRTIKQVKDQWVDLKSKIKTKAANMLKEREKTGGGQVDYDLLSMDDIEEKLDNLLTFEKKIVRTNGKDWLLGIEGGLDTADMTPPPSPTLVDLDDVDLHAQGTNKVDKLVSLKLNFVSNPSFSL